MYRGPHGQPDRWQPAPAAGLPLLASKLSPPRSPRWLVARARLLQQLDAGVQDRLTVLTGPAGSGKSVLLSSWVATAELPGPVVWLSLDAADNDPARFWYHLLTAVRQSGAAPPSGRLGSLGLPIGGPDRGFLLGLSTALAELEEPLVVVLDDFHELTNPAVLDGLVTVLGGSPAALRLVVASREDPPQPLAPLRVVGPPHEIRAAELAFTVEEAATLLASHGLVLAGADLALVRARTDGWAAGLRLAALSLQDHPDPEGFIAGFAGNQTVANFLLEEVLGRLPGEDQAFLLHTSVVERLSGELADALTGRGDGAETLARLERTNPFVAALGQDRSWYRYHQLLADLLRDQLRASAPQLVPTLHRRATGWYQDHGFPVEAIRHALAGGQWALAAELLATIWRGFILDGEMAMLGQLVDQFPSEVVVADAELVTMRAARRLGAGDWDGADKDLRLAERVAATLPPRRRGRFRISFATVSLYRARLRGDLEAAVVAARQMLPGGGDGLAELVGDDDLRALALLNLGIAELWTGALEAAARHLSEGLAAARRAGRDGLVVGFLGQLAAVTGASRRLGESVRLAREALALAERRGWSRHPSAACAYLVLGGAHFEWGALAAAERYLDLAMACRPEPAIRLTIGLTRAVMAHAKGEPAAGLAILGGAQQELQRFNGPHVMAASLREWEARLLAATGRVRQARALLSPLEEGPPSQAAAPAVRAELQLAEGDAAGAVATLAPCLAASAPSLMPYQRVEALLLDAVARLRLGHHDQAARSLEHALELAEPEGYRQVFWSLGEEVRALLLRQRDLGTAHPRLLDELLGGPAFDGPSTLAARVALPRFLTNHEEASLGFLDSSLNTPKITDELYTSINTVKSYLRRIYRELAASRANRRL